MAARFYRVSLSTSVGRFDARGVRYQYKTTNYGEALRKFQSLRALRIRFDVGLVQINSRNLRVSITASALRPRKRLIHAIISN